MFTKYRRKVQRAIKDAIEARKTINMLYNRIFITFLRVSILRVSSIKYPRWAAKHVRL